MNPVWPSYFGCQVIFMKRSFVTNFNMNNHLASLQRVELKSLDPNLTNIFVVVIIIGKQRPRVLDIQNSNNSGLRAVWNFTVRDSIQHYTNVSYWGSPEVIFQANDKFSTGHVVELINPQIIIRKLEDRSEQFHPMVTSPFRLSLADKSTIVNHPDAEPYLRLLQIPTKPTAMFVPVHDIQSRGSSIQFADVLGAVRGINQVRTIRSKMNNDMIQVRDIEVFDHTSPSLKISLWEPDLINRSNTWKPRTTILFMTDLKIEWSNFVRAYVGRSTGRTIVTENPYSNEAKSLFEYAQNAPIETFAIVEQLITSLPNYSSGIEEILTVRQVHGKINACIANRTGVNKSFMVTLFVFVTELDLDGLQETLLIKCGHCKLVIKGLKCENSECPVVFGNEPIAPEITYNIKVALTDHTGTLINCRLSGHVAEAILGCSAAEFYSMSDDQKCNLKWKYLLEQCKIRIAVIFAISQNPVLSVLAIERATPGELAQKIPVY